jgi:hypothetical protein
MQQHTHCIATMRSTATTSRRQDPSSSSSSVPLSARIEGTTTIDFARLYKEEKRRIQKAAPEQPKHPPELDRETALPVVEVTPPWNYDASLLLGSLPPLLPLLCPKLGRNCLFYQQHFLPPSFHDALYHWLLHELPERPYHTANHPEFSSSAAGAFWTTLPHAQRRVALLTTPFPTPLQQLVQSLARSAASTPLTPAINHILLNHYPSPAHGILPHTDGPAYAPYTITVSLGPGDVLLRFTASEQRATVLLHGRGSCVRFQDAAYTQARHAIATGVDEECTTDDCGNAPAGQSVVRSAHRISITLRHFYARPPEETVPGWPAGETRTKPID